MYIYIYIHTYIRIVYINIHIIHMNVPSSDFSWYSEVVLYVCGGANSWAEKHTHMWSLPVQRSVKHVIDSDQSQEKKQTCAQFWSIVHAVLWLSDKSASKRSLRTGWVAVGIAVENTNRPREEMVKCVKPTGSGTDSRCGILWIFLKQV